MVVRIILKLSLLVREGNTGENSNPVIAVDYLDTDKYPDWIYGYLEYPCKLAINLDGSDGTLDGHQHCLHHAILIERVLIGLVGHCN
jgi:hypothetical protein